MRVTRACRRPIPRRPRIGTLALGLSAALSACAVGPDFRVPDAPATARYTSERQPTATAQARALPTSQGEAQTFATDVDVPADWWTRFGSPPLNALVAQALADSPTLRQAEAKLREAQENYRAQAGARLLPSADLKLSGTREQVDLASFGITSVPSPGPFTLYNASVNISYTLDVFGGNRRALESLAAQVDYQRFELEAARLSLAGNVVTTALRQASARAQRAALEGMLAAQRVQLDITQARERAGGRSRRRPVPPARRDDGQGEARVDVDHDRPRDLDGRVRVDERDGGVIPVDARTPEQLGDQHGQQSQRHQAPQVRRRPRRAHQHDEHRPHGDRRPRADRDHGVGGRPVLAHIFRHPPIVASRITSPFARTTEGTRR